MLDLRAQCFAALADPIRLKILELLRSSDLCTCDIQIELHVSRAQLRHHLDILEAAQLVTGTQDGDWRYYSIQADPIRQLKDYLDFLGEPLLLPAQHCGRPEVPLQPPASTQSSVHPPLPGSRTWSR